MKTIRDTEGWRLLRPFLDRLRHEREFDAEELAAAINAALAQAESERDAALERARPHTDGKRCNTDAMARGLYQRMCEELGPDHEGRCVSLLTTALDSFEDRIAQLEHERDEQRRRADGWMEEAGKHSCEMPVEMPCQLPDPCTKHRLAQAEHERDEAQEETQRAKADAASQQRIAIRREEERNEARDEVRRWRDRVHEWERERDEARAAITPEGSEAFARHVVARLEWIAPLPNPARDPLGATAQACDALKQAIQYTLERVWDAKVQPVNPPAWVPRDELVKAESERDEARRERDIAQQRVSDLLQRLGNTLADDQ